MPGFAGHPFAPRALMSELAADDASTVNSLSAITKTFRKELAVKPSPMAFDALVYSFLALAVVLGFLAGLLRSLATILAYVLAAPFAIGVAPALSNYLTATMEMPPAFSGLVLAVTLLLAGMLMSWLFRRAVGDLAGHEIGIFDRLFGATLGAARAVMVAVLIVLIFDQLIPRGRDPAFLRGSQLRPLLSAAGEAGMRQLPPKVADYIDSIKRTRRI
jgi:membrane protein required for colicin V production